MVLTGLHAEVWVTTKEDSVACVEVIDVLARVSTIYFLNTAPKKKKKKKKLRHGLALKLECKINTSMSAATYMTVHWRYVKYCC